MVILFGEAFFRYSGNQKHNMLFWYVFPMYYTNDLPSFVGFAEAFKVTYRGFSADLTSTGRKPTVPCLSFIKISFCSFLKTELAINHEVDYLRVSSPMLMPVLRKRKRSRRFNALHSFVLKTIKLLAMFLLVLSAINCLYFQFADLSLLSLSLKPCSASIKRCIG